MKLNRLAAGLVLGFGFGVGDDARGFGLRLGLDLVGHGHGALLGVGNTLRAFVAGFREGLRGALVGGLEFGLALVGGSQTVSDFLRAFVDSLDQRRPHELHREPCQDQKHDGLREQSCVYVHGVSFR